MSRPVKVLIAEHDGDAREALVELLDESAVAIALTATDGRRALKAFYRERPDVVILALELPELSGWEVLATVRELSDVPVLILADENTETEKVRALRAGANDFMAKPFSRAEILARIEVLLRRPRAIETPAMFVPAAQAEGRRGRTDRDRARHRLPLPPAPGRWACAGGRAGT